MYFADQVPLTSVVWHGFVIESQSLEKGPEYLRRNREANIKRLSRGALEWLKNVDRRYIWGGGD